jgi:diacylglycerol kinase family enzyme
MRLIVYNPRGGAAIWNYQLRAALRVLGDGTSRAATVATRADDMVGPIRRALQENPGVTQVVACGGDGTVGACAAALDGRDIPIGIVPTGTTNVLAFELGLPTSPVKAAALLDGPMRRARFRTWSVNGFPMLLQLGVGFDGRLIWRTPRRVKRAMGFVGVALSALRQGVTFDYPEMRVTGTLDDGGALDAVATSVMVANAQRWAGPQVAVPGADPADDLLDLLLLDHRNFAQLATFWFGILLPGARHLGLPYVRRARVRHATIEGLGRAVEAHIDGEPLLTTPIAVEPLGAVTLLART